jgi:hypothetical protein
MVRRTVLMLPMAVLMEGIRAGRLEAQVGKVKQLPVPASEIGASGTNPKAQAEEYGAYASVSGLTIGAEYLVRSAGSRRTWRTGSFRFA